MYDHDRGPASDLAVAASFIRYIRTGCPDLDLELQEMADRIVGIHRRLPTRRPETTRQKLITRDELASHTG